VYPSNTVSRLKKDKYWGGDLRFEIRPVDDKLGYIFYRVLEVEMVPVAVIIRVWPMPGIELDAVDVVPEL
jgi:hypothetical protein